MAASTVVEGVLVAHQSRPYDFEQEDYEGKKTRQQGVARRVYLVTDFNVAPQELKFRQDAQGLFDTLVSQAEFGTPVSVRVDLGVSKNQVTMTVAELLAIGDQKKAS